MSVVAWIDRRFYPESGSNWDDELFRERIVARLDRSSTVLDVGAGSGIVRQMNMKGVAGRVFGVDTDPRVRDNPYLDEGKVAEATAIPYPDETFDLAFANNVLEHLADPGAVFAEIGRTLRPAGRFLFKTPNRRHYVAILARLTPHRFHEWVNSLRGRDAADTYPTLYRANTARDVHRFAESSGFEVVSLEHVEGRPEYLRINGLTYLIGLAYERLVNRFEVLAGFRVILIGELRRRGATSA